MSRFQTIILALSGIVATIAGALHAGILFLFGEPPALLKSFASFFALAYDAPAKVFSRTFGYGYNFPFLEMTHAQFIADWLIYMTVSFIAWGSIGLAGLHLIMRWSGRQEMP